MISLIGTIVMLVLLVGLLAWMTPEVIRDFRDMAASIAKWITDRRSAQAQAARTIEEINRQSNETITRLQFGYWQAQQQMREELDRDE